MLDFQTIDGIATKTKPNARTIEFKDFSKSTSLLWQGNANSLQISTHPAGGDIMHMKH
eukprot:m.58590 g.58590  ORF g.58590 m.58590 type:complete len:58 (+) comp13158_c0_seq1:200-373(+)